MDKKAIEKTEVQTEIVEVKTDLPVTETIEETPVNEATLERTFVKEEKTFKQMLEEQPKVDILIPENPNNPGEVVPVGINGVIYAIPTGQSFKVPQSIYDTWKYSYEKTREANKRMDDVLMREIIIT